MIGQTLNSRYKITDRLGKGAMGTVYRATDTQSGRMVAVKIIASDLAVDPTMLERFRREGETLRQLKHPNIVEFLDAFQYEEQYVIVMEYIPGGSLHELISKGPLPVDRASRITLELCDALIRSHHLYIVHRDIKPENVLLAEDGTPKLADFGVARLSEGTRMTRSGTQVGTPYYMAPEAWEGKTLDEQADIWSLGVMLFEMLSGQVPFGGDTGAAVMKKVLTTPPPDLKKIRADVPASLVKIVSQMLTRDKNRRYQTMREVGVDVERSQRALTTKPPATNRIGALKNNLGPGRYRYVIGIGMLILAVFLAVNLFRSQRAVTDTPASFPTVPGADPGATSASAVDGMPLVYVPEGGFAMGSDADEALLDCEKYRSDCQRDWFINEEPPHTVILEAFWIDKIEVTNAMYAQCVEDGECNQPSDITSYSDTDFANHPVVYVSWSDANSYCAWADRRLPSEAEWEKAASWDDQAKEKYTYPWGNEFACRNGNFDDETNLDEFIVPGGEHCDGFPRTSPAGGFSSGIGPYGTLDMAGNVWEWVGSLYAAYPYDSNDGREEFSAAGNRVLRGGSWFNLEYNVRSTYRHSDDPSRGSEVFGFRCALSASVNDAFLSPSPVPTGFTDDTGVPMALVPAGQFTMGSDTGDDDERPIHQVFLNAYYMDTYEITNTSYKACVEAGVCDSPRETGSATRTGYFENSEFGGHPVVYVDWYQARMYCEWRGARLPTEAEWEKSARGEKGLEYPWIDTSPINPDLANYFNDFGDTREVGFYMEGRSEYGIYDLAGNVWEWVSDYYDPNYYNSLQPGAVNPAGPSSGDMGVIRGGSWNDAAASLRSSNRAGLDLTATGNDLGFRCATDAPDPSGEQTITDENVWSGIVSVRMPTLNEIREEMPSIWDANGLSVADMLTPGVQTFSGSADSGQEYLWPIYWCAIDRATLDENVKSISTTFLVNGEEVPAEYIFDYYLDTSTGWKCRYSASIIGGLPQNTSINLQVSRILESDIFDGQKTYPAGSYLYEMVVSIE